jgi:hypothetical protein
MTPPLQLLALGLLVTAGMVMPGTSALLAQTSMKTHVDDALKFQVEIPADCRQQDGPGTFEVICDVMLDGERAKDTSIATAFLLEVSAEQIAAGAPPFGETELRAEIPESVCGESASSKVKIGALEATTKDTLPNLSAEVICPPIRFLAVPERKAFVRYVTAPALRYRIMVRAPSEDLERLKPIAQSFLTSFKLTAEKKP